MYEQFDHLFQVGKSVYIRLTSQKDGCHQNLNDCARGKRDCSTRHVGLDRMTRGKSTNKFGIAALMPSIKQKLTILSRKRMTWLQRLMVATAASVGSGEPLLVDIVKLTYDKGLMLELLAAPCSKPRIWTRKAAGPVPHVQHIIIRAVPTHVVRTEYGSRCW